MVARTVVQRAAAHARTARRTRILLASDRGGTAAQWHTQTRTAKSAVLRQLAPLRVYVEVNPEDVAKENLRPSQRVLVESRRGSVEARVFVTHSVHPGQLFMPMHYAETNQLTHGHFDPYSKQPSYKDSPLRFAARRKRAAISRRGLLVVIAVLACFRQVCEMPKRGETCEEVRLHEQLRIA